MEKESKIKALIIDDEPRAVNMLRILIKKFIPEIHLIMSANDPKKGLAILETSQPDILFLDIQMPLMNGFELLRQAPMQNTEVIFTTAFSQYAVQAIRVSAIDYLLKPIEVEELKAAVARYLEKKNSNQDWKGRYENLIHNLKIQENQQQRLALSSLEGTIYIDIKDIIRCEASSNYTYFFMIEGKKHIASKTMKEFEDILKEHHFIRVHKSHLVNINHVKEYSGEHVFLSDNSQIIVSRRRKSFVLMKLKKH